MENWGLRIKYLREQRHWKQDDLTDKSSVPRETIAQIETGRIKKPEYVAEFARAFDVPQPRLVAYLYSGDITVLEQINDDNEIIFKLDQRIKVLPIPIRGYINAGTLTTLEAIDLGVAWVEKDKISGVKKMDAVFALKISGDSLIGDKINNEDIVVIDPNPDLIEGRIYAVKLQNEFVARHVHREDGYVILTSSNGKYERMKVEEAEIIGRIIWSQPPGQSH